MNPGELFAGLFPTNIQPCQTSSSSTTSPSATGYGTTPSGSTPSSSTPAPSGPTFSFAGSFSSSFTKSDPDETVNTGTFATSFSGAWGTNKNGFFCSLNQDPGTTTTTPGGIRPPHRSPAARRQQPVRRWRSIRRRVPTSIRRPARTCRPTRRPVCQ